MRRWRRDVAVGASARPRPARSALRAAARPRGGAAPCRPRSAARRRGRARAAPCRRSAPAPARAAETVGCETPSRSAAREKPPYSSTARNASSRRVATIPPASSIGMYLWWQAYSRFAAMRGRRYRQVVSHRTTILVLALLSQSATSLVQFGLPALFFALRDEFGIGPARFGFIFARHRHRLGRRCWPSPAGSATASARGPCSSPARSSAPLGPAARRLRARRGGARPRRCFIAGIGGAAVPVAGMTTLLRVFPPEQRGHGDGPAPDGRARRRRDRRGAAAAARPPRRPAPGLRRAGGPRARQRPRRSPPSPARASATASRAPAMRASCRPACRGCSLVGALYVSALGGVLAFTAAAAEDAGLSTTEAGDRPRAAQRRRRRRPRGLGPRRRPRARHAARRAR